jgi:hypothetical protein
VGVLCVAGLFSFSLSLKAQKKLLPSYKYNQRRVQLSSARNIGDQTDLLRLYALKNGLDFDSLQASDLILFDLDERGQPVFLELHETRSGRVVKADQVYPMGSTGLRLTGKGEVVGVFDGGRVQLDHPEFQGRVEQKDEVTGLSAHATHVSGIIAAAGLNPDTRGIAYEAEIDAYSFSNWSSKIITAAEEGVALSNHSYGTAAGWRRDSDYEYTWRWFGDTTLSQDVDWKFGFYNSTSRYHDEFIYVNPYHLFITSAGNSRNQRGPSVAPYDHEISVNGNWVKVSRQRTENGPYDSTPLSGTAKNILTVGAASANNPGEFSIASFSSWGPTDDGRIKPDIMGVGVNVLSTIEDSESASGRYGSMSGTSMSSPNVAGGMALIRQHFIQYHNYVPLASTLKALAIHAARQHPDLPPGPDYRTGWGMLDVERAVNQITKLDSINYLIEETILQSGQTASRTIHSDGQEPIEVVLVWTDLPGVPPPVSVNPKDTMLVNDLDMVLVDPKGEVHYPFLLNPDAPSEAPTRGINSLDNVEKVFIENPLEGEYEIRITHKGEVLENEEQIFSLVANAGPLENSFESLFWIGGNEGSWHDPQNWSNAANGEPVNRIPTPRDIVRIENHDSLRVENRIFLEGDAECLNFFFNADSLANVDLNGFQLQVDGSFLANPSLKSLENGRLNFTGTRLRFNGLRLPSSLPNVELQFAATQASRWEIESDLQADLLVVENGILDLSNKTLQIKELRIADEATGQIDLSNSKLVGITALEIPESKKGMVILDGTSLFIDSEKARIQGLAGSLASIVSASPDAFFQGDFEVDSVTISQNSTWSGTVNAKSLVIQPGSEVIFGENTLLQANTSQLNSSVNDPVTFKGLSDYPGTFRLNGIRKVCMDFLFVENVKTDGEATLNAGPSGQLLGITDGWFQTDCEKVLFANFNYQYPCLGNTTTFENTSSGVITNRQWEIRNVQGDRLASFDQDDFTYDFQDKGFYTVTLTISDASGIERSVSRELEVIENNIGEVLLFEDVLGLAASLPGLSYQWFRNGELLENANDRFFQPSESGFYTVEVSNGTCSVVSNAFEYVSEVVSIASPDPAARLTLTPNPSTAQVQLQWWDDARGELSITLLSGTGTKIWEKTDRKTEQLYETFLLIQHLPRGVYLVKVQGQGERSQWVKRIIKE